MKKYSIKEIFNIQEVQDKLFQVQIAGHQMTVDEYMALEIQDILLRFKTQFPDLTVKDANFEYISGSNDYLLAGEITTE